MSKIFPLKKIFCLVLMAWWVLTGLSCAGGGSDDLNVKEGVFGPNVHGTPDTFRGAGIINNDDFLIGGPLAQGRQGDILLQNDHIRVIIQKPTRNTGVALFGGNILDADIFRPSSEPGQDHFGTLFPLINIAWTVNYRSLEIINADFANGPIVIRATGILDVYDYIQTNIIAIFAKINLGIDLFYADRFDDIFDPFVNVPELRDFNPIVVTDYTLKPDKNYVIVETKYHNKGEDPIQIPVGDWLNGSGNLEPFFPTQGFLNTKLVEPTTAMIYSGMEDNVHVSYGYFYNPIQLIQEDGTIPNTTSLTISGVTPFLLGETFLEIIPIGGPQKPKINFVLEPGVRTVTRYFVVGDGDVASVIDSGFEALGVPKVKISGRVVDSGGIPVERARVAILDEGRTVTVAYSDANGEFAADVSNGIDNKAKMFGSGAYTVEVYKEGYLLGSSHKAGKCTGGSVDVAAGTVTGIQCQLGSTGTLTVSATEDGQPTPARVTIVGFDPSPIHDPANPGDFGKYTDINLRSRPFGIVDVFYLGPDGNAYPHGHQRIIGGNQVRLEPGDYMVYITRGTEYSVYRERISVAAGGSTTVHGEISKVLDTSGFVGIDMHLHGINSADSAFGLASRAYGALAEGMDVLLSTDHDFVTDYGPVVRQLGLEPWITTMVGDEITPLAWGHLLAFPLTPDPNSTTGGAYDYTYVPTDDRPGPEHDMGQTMGETFRGIDEANPGTQVLQIAHIMDRALGNFGIFGLVTSTAFEGVEPLSTWQDPVRFRMPPNTNSGGGFSGPYPLGTNGAFTLDFTALELIVGPSNDILHILMEEALPTYFNLLNLGVIATATGSSDSHVQVKDPVGSPRNYVMSSVDPRDGLGSNFQAIDSEEIAVNTNDGEVIVTNGVFIRPQLKATGDSQGVTVGGTIVGTGDVTLELEITSAEYFDWDTVEIFANTTTIPAKDDLSGVTDLSAREFYRTAHDHTPRYLMTPLFSYHKSNVGDSALTQTVSGGVRRATISRDFHFSEDTWIVIVVRGSEGVKSLFPYVPRAADTEVDPANFLDLLETNPVALGGIPAFAFTNPMFVDIDGNGFEAIHIRDGKSPLAK